MSDDTRDQVAAIVREVRAERKPMSHLWSEEVADRIEALYAGPIEGSEELGGFTLDDVEMIRDEVASLPTSEEQAWRSLANRIEARIRAPSEGAPEAVDLRAAIRGFLSNVPVESPTSSPVSEESGAAGWRPMSEAPKPGGESILAMDGDGLFLVVHRAGHPMNEDQWADRHGYIEFPLTHWMHLPSPAGAGEVE